ncbi:hypothetical protein P7K49_004433, partial [Saguinus oedipus]
MALSGPAAVENWPLNGSLIPLLTPQSVSQSLNSQSWKALFPATFEAISAQITCNNKPIKQEIPVLFKEKKIRTETKKDKGESKTRKYCPERGGSIYRFNRCERKGLRGAGNYEK